MVVTTNATTGQEETLQIRSTDLLGDKDRTIKISVDQKWPKVFCFQNPLAGVWHNRSDISFNFIWLDQSQSNYPCNDITLEKIVLPPKAVVRAIELREFKDTWHPDQFGVLDRKSKPKL